MQKTKRISSLAAFLTVALFLVGTVAAASYVIPVMGDTSAGENQPGWLFNRDTSTSTPFEFNTDEASLGQGSLYVQPIGANASDKFIGEFFINKRIDKVKSVSYDFKIGPNGDASDENEFYMNVYANFGESDRFKFYDCRYNIVPTTGSTTDFTTVTFDRDQSYPVTTRSSSPYPCPSVPSEMDDLSPHSKFRMVALNVGDTSANDVGLDGYLDNVVVTLNDTFRVFDFEPTLTPETVEECENDGWMTFNAPSFFNERSCVKYVVKNS